MYDDERSLNKQTHLININYKMAQEIRYFILTGEPGVGKTTLTKKLCVLLSDKGVKMAGFVTEEVKKKRIRLGFDVVTIDGTRGILARDKTLLSEPVQNSVGKYGVLVKEFEKVALPSLQLVDQGLSCYVIDEIGKMEFFSSLFVSRIKEIFAGYSYVLATIPVSRTNDYIDLIRHNINSKIWTVTRENRSTIHEVILKEMQTVMGLN